MVGSMKLQPDDGPRYSLGIGPSSDDAVGSRRKFTRRFTEGMGKLVGNVKGDRWEEDRRTCHKIDGSYRSMPELDDAVGPRREFARRFAEGIGKLVGNMPGDCRKKTIGLTVRMPEATGLTRVRS
ncbi:hypothetical protein B296_00029671 [Ensete ventricosum]|uniref:Uncharacterized protein n=1 Tax=Ensete ventricosum TaxID=4639 RepID=A0A426XL34_ENSVE|nr:hypothetical protein B296_00029671 [Ensete ventricosum]